MRIPFLFVAGKIEKILKIAFVFCCKNEKSFFLETVKRGCLGLFNGNTGEKKS
jgi:hypothetical protein